MEGFNAATITILVAVAGSAIGVMTLVVTLFVQLRTDIRAVRAGSTTSIAMLRPSSTMLGF